MADVDVSIFNAVRARGGVSVPTSGVVIGQPLPQPVNPPSGVFEGVGVKINGKNIGGVKRYIQANEVLEIPPLWQYNVFGLAFTVDGIVNNEGEINLI